MDYSFLIVTISIAMESLISQLGFKLANSTFFFFLLLSLDIKNIEDLDEWKKKKITKEVHCQR